MKTKLDELKKRPYKSLTVPGIINDYSFTLFFLTKECADHGEIIKLLSKWRKKHEYWFSEHFPISDKRTRSWFISSVIEGMRVLFFIDIAGKYMGHVGLFRFDIVNKTCQIDNIVRGEDGHPGLMKAAVDTMMIWGRLELGIKYYTLQTTSDNKRALELYKRLGFIEVGQKPLIYRKTDEGGAWVEAHRDYIGKIKRYEVYMRENNF